MTNPHPYPDTHHDPTSNTLFGFWVYLMSDVVLFGTFFATYAVLQDHTFGGPTGKQLFDLRFALIETLVLLFSSFTCGIAMLFAKEQRKNSLLAWLGVTFLLGIIFMYMEFSEFNRLLSGGNSWKNSAFLSSYFTLIGVHGLHIVIGLMVMIAFAAQLFFSGFTEIVLRRLTCLRIYWHFLYLIWIFTFAVVYLIGAK
jgi:cytochrome o ubiquinol oxidase subunit 3